MISNVGGRNAVKKKKQVHMCATQRKPDTPEERGLHGKYDGHFLPFVFPKKSFQIYERIISCYVPVLNSSQTS